MPVTIKSILYPLTLKGAKYPFPLVTYVAISTPVTKAVSLMDVDMSTVGKNPPTLPGDTNVWAANTDGRKLSIGYDIHFYYRDFDDSTVNNNLTHELTKWMVLHPIAAATSLIVLVSSLLAPALGFVYVNISLVLAILITTKTFIIDCILWTTFRNNFHGLGVKTRYGNGFWMTLASLILLIMAAALSFGSKGGYRRAHPVNVLPVTHSPREEAEEA
ncbi:hypothetical protein DL96DRAFT_1589570 [Flagelloscypha sp. PMI_526]|nr:hypothetical protein DL96DRAFT_1589570 [Flagelloscypha sp. PMI_526]